VLGCAGVQDGAEAGAGAETAQQLADELAAWMGWGCGGQGQAGAASGGCAEQEGQRLKGTNKKGTA